MDDRQSKVDHVKHARDTNLPPYNHYCHWSGCNTQVPPAMWGCYRHWMMLPKYLRNKVWAAYQPGQEITKRVSREYLEVAREVQEWIFANYPETTNTNQDED